MAYVYLQNARWDRTTVLRQTPLFSGHLGGNIFSNLPGNKYEWTLIEGKPSTPDHIIDNIPRERRIVFVMENPSIWKHGNDVYDYVGIVVSPFNLDFPPHIRWIEHHPAVPWFYGIPFRTDTGLSHHQTTSCLMSLHEIFHAPFPEKKKLLSIVSSTKEFTPGHKWRLQVTQALKSYFGSDLDVFGFGFNPISCKEHAVDPYHFSIAIENSGSEFYMTEKISDVCLGSSMPIYSGARQVNKYFNCEIPSIEYGCSPDKFCQEVRRIVDNVSINDAILSSNKNQTLFRNNILAVVNDIISFS